MLVQMEGEVELLTQLGASKVVATPSVNDHLDRFAIDAGSCLEDIGALVFMLLCLSGQDPCDDKRWTCVMLTHEEFLIIFHSLSCHCFLDTGIKLIFTQVLFITIVMDEQDFLVSTFGRLVSFTSTLVAFTIERCITVCLLATWGQFSLRKCGLEGRLGGT